MLLRLYLLACCTTTQNLVECPEALLQRLMAGDGKRRPSISNRQLRNTSSHSEDAALAKGRRQVARSRQSILAQTLHVSQFRRDAGSPRHAQGHRGGHIPLIKKTGNTLLPCNVTPASSPRAHGSGARLKGQQKRDPHKSILWDG